MKKNNKKKGFKALSELVSDINNLNADKSEVSEEQQKESISQTIQSNNDSQNKTDSSQNTSKNSENKRKESKSTPSRKDESHLQQSTEKQKNNIVEINDGEQTTLISDINCVNKVKFLTQKNYIKKYGVLEQQLSEAISSGILRSEFKEDILYVEDIPINRGIYKLRKEQYIKKYGITNQLFNEKISSGVIRSKEFNGVLFVEDASPYATTDNFKVIVVLGLICIFYLGYMMYIKPDISTAQNNTINKVSQYSPPPQKTQQVEPIPRAMQAWLDRNPWYWEHGALSEYAQAELDKMVNNGWSESDIRAYDELDRRIAKHVNNTKRLSNHMPKISNEQNSVRNKINQVSESDRQLSPITQSQIDHNSSKRTHSRKKSSNISRQFILEAQNLLIVLGYKPGPVDGLWGRKTKNAIKSFQFDNKLPQKVGIDETLLSALRDAVKKWQIAEETTILVEKQEKKLPDSVGNMQFVKIPSGCFQMGSNNGKFPETPVHEVCITNDFYLGKYEITQAQWYSIMGNNPSFNKTCGKDCPVEMVSWNDVQIFIRKVNRLTSKTHRLPTEAEWEYACRSGGKKQKYCGSDLADRVAWHQGNIGRNKKTRSIGQKQSNGLGLFDMTGNVEEWIQDWWASKYYQISPINNPKGPLKGKIHSVRGGSWHNRAKTSTSRSVSDGKYGSTIGFRLVRTL